MNGFVKVLQDLGLLVARIALGVTLVVHGWLRWQGPGRGVQEEVDYLTQFATPFPEYAVWGAIGLEIVGGLFLIVGALTPLVAAAVLVEQALIVAYTNWYQWSSVFGPEGTGDGGIEYNVALGALALLLLVFGAGRVSVDQAFRRRKPDAADESAADDRTRERTPVSV